MPDLSPKLHQKVKLKGTPTGESLPDSYEVTKVGRTTVEVLVEGIPQLIHKTRIAEVIDSGESYSPPTYQEEEPMATETKTAPVVKKEVNKPAPFDLAAWVNQHGGVHYFKNAKFDHPSYKLTAHVVIDEPNGYYYTINTYTYPDGEVSPGKKGIGGNKFPLKGHQLTQPAKEKGGEPRRLKGNVSSTDLVTRLTKEGYTKA